MALISFGYRVNMYAPSLLPTDPGGYIVAYDLDGVLKQKNYQGVVTLVGSGAGGPQGPPGPVGPAGLTWSGAWVATQSYSVNYAVGYASASWWCISGVTGATGNDSPDIDTTHWTLLAAQGSPGSQGSQGEHGLDGPQGPTGSQGATGSPGNKGGLLYEYGGGMSFNNPDPSLVTEVSFNDITEDGANVGNYINSWQTGGTLVIQSNTNGDSTYTIFNVNAVVITPIFPGGGVLYQVGVSYIEGTAPTTGEICVVNFSFNGPTGATGHGVTSSFYLQGTTDYSYDTTSDIYRTGSLAIGTSASSTSRLYVYATQSGAFRLQDGSQGNNYILTSNSIGMGSWTSSINVTGFQLQDGNQGSGKVLTSDLYGVASWTALSTVGISGSASYIPRFTGTSSLGNSKFFDNGTTGSYGSSPDCVTFIPGSNIYLRLLRGQSSMDFTLGNPGATQSGIIKSYNTYGLDIQSQGYLALSAGPSFTEAMRISSNGYVGIGLTATPSTKLHIYATQSGAFRLVDGTQGTGKVLISDSNGVATWTSSIQTQLDTKLTAATGTINYLQKVNGVNSLGNSQIFDNGTYIGISTMFTPNKDITLGNQVNREIGIEESTNILDGRDLTLTAGRTVNYVPGTNFLGLLAGGYQWISAEGHPNGDVYVVDNQNILWVQTGGAGAFSIVPGNSGGDYGGILSIISNGVSIGHFYVARIGSFAPFRKSIDNGLTWTTPVGILSPTFGYRDMAYNSFNGLLYLITNQGVSSVIHTYNPTSGVWTDLGQTPRNYNGLICSPNGDVYACVAGDLMYMQSSGTGNFNSLAIGSYQWNKGWATVSGDIYFSINGISFRKRTGGLGNTVVVAGLSLSGNPYQSRQGRYGISTQGNVYAPLYVGDIYVQYNNGAGTANLQGGVLKLQAGTGKGTGDSNLDFYTGQKLTSGTDMQTSTLRLRINNEGNIGIGTASPSTKLHVYATQSGVFRLEDTTQGPGYVLTSDANGVASWTSSLTGLSLLGNSEVISTEVIATASVVVYDYSLSSLWYHGTASSNFTANFINLPTTDNRVLSTSIVINQGLNGYIPNIVQIEGVTQSVKWPGGTQSGTSYNLDIVTFNFIRTSGTWTNVIGQVASFT